MLVVGAARGPESSHAAALHGGDVGRKEAVRGTELEVRVGVQRIALDGPLGKGDGTLEMLAKRPVDVRRRWSSRHAAAGLPKVVLGGHGALDEERSDPERGGEQAVRRRVVRIGLHGRPEGLERFGVIEVVTSSQARHAEPLRFGSCLGGRLCNHADENAGPDEQCDQRFLHPDERLRGADGWSRERGLKKC